MLCTTREGDRKALGCYWVVIKFCYRVALSCCRLNTLFTNNKRSLLAVAGFAEKGAINVWQCRMSRRGRQDEAGPSNSQPAGEIANVQRMAFLQALMKTQCMKEADCKQLLRQIVNINDGKKIVSFVRLSSHVYQLIFGSNADTAYPQVLAKLNQDLKFAGFEIKTVKHQVYLVHMLQAFN